MCRKLVALDVCEHSDPTQRNNGLPPVLLGLKLGLGLDSPRRASQDKRKGEGKGEDDASCALAASR